jgi:hypothetical protein
MGGEGARYSAIDMPADRTNPLIRILPSIADFAFLMPLVFLFSGLHGARTLLSDGDTGWHVRTGEWILSHGRVPHHDLFSYTRTDQPWFAWEWLWDVIFGWLHQHWGMGAVVAGSLLLICLASGLLFRVASRKCGNPIVAIAVTFLAVAASSIHFLARPHLVTLLFTVLFYALLERVREGNRTRLLLWLPPLTVLWTNLHGGWFVGIVLLGLYAAGELTGGILEAQARTLRQALARSVPYAAAAFFCLAASLVGPYTYHLHVHIFHYLTDSFQREHILEMLPLSFQHPAARYFEIMLLAGGAAALWHLRRKRYTECLLLLSFAHLGLIASRNIPIFAIIATPVLALAAAEWIRTLEDAPVAGWLQSLSRGVDGLADSIRGMEAVPRAHLVSAAVLLIVTAIFYAPSPPPSFRASFDAKTFPVKALASLGPDSRIFTYDQWGDFLIYKLYPKTRVFIDGRSDFYGSTFGKRYLDILGVKYSWQQHLDEYGVDTVLMPADAPLSGALKESSRWHVVYDDGVAIVFRSDSRPDSSQVSAAMSIGGKDRDRKITNSGPRDRTITKTKT